jgi:hypothetical protein
MRPARASIHLAAIAALVACVVFIAGCAPEPSEQNIRARFEYNRAKFERLRVLVNERPTIVHVNDDIVFRPENGQLTSSAQVQDPRIPEVRELMRATGVERIVNFRRALEFQLWEEPGHLRGQSLKGVAFTRVPPAAVLSSVDGPKRNVSARLSQEIFSKIDDAGWYVWFNFGN